MVRPERDRLAGIVEVDETFAGGVSVGRLGASSDKLPVVVAVEKPGPDAGSDGSDSRSPIALEPWRLVNFAQRMVTPGSTIHTDGAPMMRRLDHLG